jgi:hypothetical protein
VRPDAALAVAVSAACTAAHISVAGKCVASSPSEPPETTGMLVEGLCEVFFEVSCVELCSNVAGVLQLMSAGHAQLVTAAVEGRCAAYLRETLREPRYQPPSSQPTVLPGGVTAAGILPCCVLCAHR